MSTQPQIITVPSSGSTGLPVAIVGGLLIVGAAFAGYHYIQQQQKNNTEGELDTPAGAVMLQLKSVFDNTVVNDAEYKRVALLITPDIKDDVYKLYLKNTGRNLSDDIANRIGTGTQITTAKQEVINSTTGTLIKITPDDKIKFMVGKGGIVRFEPGSVYPINLFEKPEGVLPKGILSQEIKPYYTLQPTALQFRISDVKEVDFNSFQLAEGWSKVFKPIVRTRKVFAAVQIELPLKADANGVKRIVRLWADARQFRIGKGTAYLKGLHGLGETTSKLI